MEIRTKLLPHQEEAAQKLRNLRVGALFMEMGTGKTLTAIELIRQRAEKISKVVYLCPVNLKHDVAAEFARHSPDTTIYVFTEKTKDGLVPSANVYIVGIESIAQSDREYLACNSIIDSKTCVILDESDTCKNHAALRARRIIAMSDRARYRFALTGTATGEGIVDLYAQMRFLSAEILGYRSFYSFSRNHLEYSEDSPGLIVRSLNTDYIAKKIEPFVYQVTKDECLSLPPKHYKTHCSGMTYEQGCLYREAKETILMQQDPEEEIDSYTIFRVFTALREIVSGFWNQTPDPNSRKKEPDIFHECDHNRLELLDEAIESIEGRKKVIVWVNFQYCFNQVIERLSSQFGKDAIAEYHGKTKDHSEQIAKWRNSARFLVASPKCGGRGLTLNEASEVIFYNNDFPYRLRAQAEDRCHRIGQDKAPIYRDLILEGSIDERITTALSNKESLTQQFKQELQELKSHKSKKDKLMKL